MIPVCRFTYGLFRPRQIGHGSIRCHLFGAEEDWSTRGQLLERDGLPVLTEGSHDVPGWLLRFKPEDAIAAYTTINSIEPDRLYRWAVADVRRAGVCVPANVLVGSSLCPYLWQLLAEAGVLSLAHLDPKERLGKHFSCLREQRFLA
jgi:hypothetical protein